MIDGVKDIWLEKGPLSEDPDGCVVPLQEIPVLCELGELDLGQIHERIHLVLRTFEVFNAERVDRDHLDTRLVANFEDLQEECQTLVYCRGQEPHTLARASKPK